jgi:2-aminoethylphosphonate transport system ATP-binding protein
MSAFDAALDGARTAPSAAAAASAEAGNSIVFEGVTVAYRGTVVLDKLSLEVAPGAILALIGPSGSGKTTALRAVAGFVRPVAGRIRIGDIDVTDLPPYARGIGMVVQNYALFPHMRVEENVAFGLKAQRAPRDLVAARVSEALRMVGMEKYVGRYPRELSGGQQQRVAIARALAIRPRVLLLDEPLSALDAQIRRNMVEELARLHRDLPNLTVLYVTHDQLEALTLADRIAIMRDGRLASHGASSELYRRPPNRFTAEFLGRANVLPVTIDSVERARGLAQVRFGDTMLSVSAHPLLDAGQTCLLCVRPHDILPARGVTAGNVLEARVESVQWQGDSHNVVLSAQGQTVRLVSAPLREPPAHGALFPVHFAADHATLIPENENAR